MDSELIKNNIYYDETSPTCLRWLVTQELPDGRKTRCVKGAVVGCRNARCFYFKYKRYSIAQVVLLLHGIVFSKALHHIRYADGDRNNHKINNICCDGRKDLRLMEQSATYKDRVATNAKNTNERQLLNSARERSRRTGLSCSIQLSDIYIPSICPVLGIPLCRGVGKPTASSPTLDRKDSTRGYDPDNIHVVSLLANTMKSNASKEQLLKFAQWVFDEYS